MISLWFLYVSLCLVWFEALDHHWEQELVAYLHRNPGPHLEDLRENAPCITQSSTQKLWAKLTRVIWNHWSQPCLIMFVYVYICLLFGVQPNTQNGNHFWTCVAYGSCSQGCERPYGKIGRRTKPKPVQTKQNACNHPEHPRAPINEETTFLKCYEMLWTFMNKVVHTSKLCLASCHTWCLNKFVVKLGGSKLKWITIKKTQITTHVGTNMNKYE